MVAMRKPRNRLPAGDLVIFNRDLNNYYKSLDHQTSRYHALKTIYNNIITLICFRNMIFVLNSIPNFLMSGNFEIDLGQIAQSLGAISNRSERFQIARSDFKSIWLTTKISFDNIFPRTTKSAEKGTRSQGFYSVHKESSTTISSVLFESIF